MQLGLVDKKKAGQTKKEQHETKKQQAKAGKKSVVVDENVLLAQQAEQKKKDRARKLNLQREAKLQKRAEDGLVRQLIEEHRVARDDRGIAYRFTVGSKIQRIFVAKEVADKLSDGQLGIVGIGEQFDILPRRIIEKIQSVSDRVFIALNSASSVSGHHVADPEDPYAAYQVPDDLMW